MTEIHFTPDERTWRVYDTAAPDTHDAVPSQAGAAARERLERTRRLARVRADRRPPEGELAAAISNTIVGVLARTTGRGPTKAKTTLGENGVFVVLQDTLTRGERTLAEAGEGAAVLEPVRPAAR